MFVALSCVTSVYAQQPQPAAAADVTALAKQTQNPVGDLVSVPLQFNFNTAGDLEDATLFNLNIQPVIPFRASSGWNIIARAIVPIDNVPAADGVSYSGVGDIQLQLYATPAKPGSLIWGIGPVFSFPTATAFPLRSGTLAAGAAAVALTMKGPWVIGGLVSQYWPVTDTGDDPETNLFVFQPAINYNFGHGWAMSFSPAITANWDAASGNDGPCRSVWVLRGRRIQRTADQYRHAVLHQCRLPRRVGATPATIFHVAAVSEEVTQAEPLAWTA
jgi:hypothetical protein